nr:MAG TPA: hypothetical protein [Caudoviricetes sp.]
MTRLYFLLALLDYQHVSTVRILISIFQLTI